MQAGPPFIKRYLLLVVMVMTNLGMVLTLCGCGPNAVNVVNPDAEAFQQLLSAELAADARRPAHGMAAYVSGRSPDKGGRLDDAKLPEPYNVEVGASIRPAEYHLGYAAQRLIREYYAATHSAIQRNLYNVDVSVQEAT